VPGGGEVNFIAHKLLLLFLFFFFFFFLSFKKKKQNKTISGYILQVATKARGAVKPRAQQPFVWGWKRTTLGW